MPRSVQAYRQNAVVTNSPANVSNGDPSSAVDDGSDVFKIPPTLDVCAPATGGTRNPFVSGLNTMGSDTGNSTGVAGQTGNIMSGLQMFTDTLCGYALGDVSTGQVIEAWRQIRDRNGDPRETYRAMRRLRDATGGGTTPQSVIAGVQAVTDITNTNPAVQDAIATGQAAAGVSGNQIVDSINGAQKHANAAQQMLTGQPASGASGTDLLTAGSNTLNQNTANHAGHTSLSSAQSVVLKQQNLLVSDDFSTASTVVGDTHWSWAGTDGAPGSVSGCAVVTCDGSQQPMVSSEVPVVAGENIEVSAEIKWSGLTFTGSTPLILGVEKYRLMKDPASGSNTYTDIGWYHVTTVAAPGSSSASFTGQNNGWVGIAGTYTVEPGVDQLRFRLEVASNATAGTVKWDAANFLKLDLISDDAVPGVGMTVDSIVTQLYGTAGSGFSQNQAALALGNTASTVSSVATEVAALQAEGHTGSIAGDDFTWSGSFIGTTGNWYCWYDDVDDISGAPDGLYTANRRDAVWVPRFDNPQSFLFEWQGSDPVSTTDYQLIQLILDSAPAPGSFIGLLGRISAASPFSSYVSANIGGNGTYIIGYQSGGVFTTLASGSCLVPGLGSTLSLYCGDKANSVPRRYTLQVSGVTVATVDDSASPLGSVNWGYGWGGSTNAGQSNPPPEVRSWLAMDQ